MVGREAQERTPLAILALQEDVKEYSRVFQQNSRATGLETKPRRQGSFGLSA